MENPGTQWRFRAGKIVERNGGFSRSNLITRGSYIDSFNSLHYSTFLNSRQNIEL
jgi:hypothetical protein